MCFILISGVGWGGSSRQKAAESQAVGLGLGVVRRWEEKLRRARGDCGEARGCGRADGALTRGGRAQALQAPGARRGAAHARSAATAHHAAAVRIGTGGHPGAAAAARAQIAAGRATGLAGATRRPGASGSELQPQAGGVAGSIPAARPWLRVPRHRGAPPSGLLAGPPARAQDPVWTLPGSHPAGRRARGPRCGSPVGRRALARAHADLGRGRGPWAALGPHRGRWHRRAGIREENAPCCGAGERVRGRLVP